MLLHQWAYATAKTRALTGRIGVVGGYHLRLQRLIYNMRSILIHRPRIRLLDVSCHTICRVRVIGLFLRLTRFLIAIA